MPGIAVLPDSSSKRWGEISWNGWPPQGKLTAWPKLGVCYFDCDGERFTSGVDTAGHLSTVDSGAKCGGLPL
jgi:hypothetical protein